MSVHAKGRLYLLPVLLLLCLSVGLLWAGPWEQAAGTRGCFPGTSTAVLKGNGSGGCTPAVSGADFLPATTGTFPLFGNGLGGTSNGSVTGNTTALVSSDNSAKTVGHLMTWGTGLNATDGGAPTGVQETLLCTLNGSLATGGSGTALVYEYISSHRKEVVVIVSAYYNPSATAQACSLTSNGGVAYTLLGSIISNISPAPASTDGPVPTQVLMPISMFAPEGGVIVIDGS